ncbi:MAG: hypothetical protein PUB18_05585 [bacterium]|nr:hypothetical protein [bacterium]
MANELLKRFVNEIKRDSSHYHFYLEHPMIIHEEFQRFVKNQEKNNEYFAKLIKRHHFIKTNDHIIETQISENIASISDSLTNKNKHQIICKYGVVKTPKPLELLLTSQSCYLTNGIYEYTDEIYRQIIHHAFGSKPSFIIGAIDRIHYQEVEGIMTKINSIFFEENKKRIQLIQKELHKRHIPVTVYKENTQRHNIYMLVHRGDRK